MPDRRDFLKKIGYIAPIITTYKISDAWSEGKKNSKENSPNPGLKKKIELRMMTNE